MSLSPQATQLYDKVKSVILPAEWSEFAPDVDAILALKRERNAVILAHNYQTPEIFHGVADIVGDSLALAREAMKTDAEVIVLAGVHFMAETAKLLNPGKTVLIPDLAGRLLARRVDHRRRRAPAAPALSGRAGRDLRQHLGGGEGRERHLLHLGQRARRSSRALGVPKVIMLPDEYLAQNVANETKVEIITWAGHCEVHERFSAADVRQLRAGHPGIVVLAHPECPPEVVAEADFAGSTAAMADYVSREQPAPGRADDRVLDERQHRRRSIPDIDFVRPCNLCPHMKRITLAQDPPRARDNAARGDDRSRHRRSRPPRRRAHAGDPLGGRDGNDPLGIGRRPRHHRRRPGRSHDGAAAGAAAGDPARQDAARPGRRLGLGAGRRRCRRRRRTTTRRCTPPTRGRRRRAQRSRPSWPASPPRRPTPSPSWNASASCSTATHKAVSRSGWRPRTAAAASSTSPATAPGRRSCAR